MLGSFSGNCMWSVLRESSRVGLRIILQARRYPYSLLIAN